MQKAVEVSSSYRRSYSFGPLVAGLVSIQVSAVIFRSVFPVYLSKQSVVCTQDALIERISICYPVSQ